MLGINILVTSEKVDDDCLTPMGLILFDIKFSLWYFSIKLKHHSKINYIP